MSVPPPLAPPPAAPDRSAAHRYRLVRNSQIRLAVPGWVKRRPVLYLPLFATIVALLQVSGHPTARVAVVAGIYGALLLFWTAQAVFGRVGPDIQASLAKTTILTTLAHSGAIAATGGLVSPLSPQIFVAVISVVLLFGRSRISQALIALVIALTLLLAMLPRAIAGPKVPWPYDVALEATCIAFSFIILLANIYLVTDIHQQVGETLERMREDMLANATTRAQSLETISSKVAHELKNPLAAIKGLVQLVRRSPADARSEDRMRVVADEVARMEQILRDYLTFARPLDDLRPQPVDLGSTCRDVAQVLEARAQEAVVRLSVGGSAQVVGDPRRLKEALLNLAQNAIEATPAGGSVDVRVSGRDGGGAEIVVQDNGRGLNADELARLGTPFYSTRAGGTGLGVVLARAVFVQHGGEVTWASEPGRGTTVRVRLPATPPAAGDPLTFGETNGSRTAHR